MANVTFVQASQASNGGSGDSVSCAYGASNTSGSYLLAWIQVVASAAGLGSFSDSAGNAWNQIGSTVSVLGELWALYQCKSSLGGANTVTAATNGTVTTVNIGIAEYTGQTSSPLQASTAFVINTAVTSFVSSNVVTTFNGEQLIFLGWTNAVTDATITAGAGYTVQMPDAATAGAFLLDSATVAATPGSYNCSFSASASAPLGGYLLAINNNSVAAVPTFSPVGGNYNGAQTVTIASTTSGGTIYYTVDGSTPTHGSPSISNGSTISVGVSETVNAIASVSGFVDSSVGSATYTIAGPLAGTPTFNPPGGIYFTAQTVVISSNTSGGTIYYTTNGTTPTHSSLNIVNGGSVVVSASETIQAIESASGFTDSNLGSATYNISVAPTTNAQFQFAPVAGASDMLQFKTSGGTVVSWIDHTGTGQGNLLSTGGGGGGTTITGILPAFGSYTFSVSNIGVVSAENNITGSIDFSSSDAAVVINEVLNALALTGGVLFFKEGIYNLNSVTQETLSGWTGYSYCIGIPAAAEGSLVQWHFIGETRTSWLGESGSSDIQTNGVIFNVTATALSGAGSNIVVGIWQRPIATVQFSGEDYFEGLCVRFPSNQRGNEIAFGMYSAWTVDFNNCLADFNMSYASIASGTISAAGNIGFTSSYSSSSNLQHFKDTYAEGYYYGYDMQSEHIVADTITSQYCKYAGIIGRSGGTVYHPCVFIHVIDQENQHGWQLGSDMALGSRVDFLGYDMEYLTSGTYERVANLFETNAGYTSGLLNATVVQADVGVVNSAALFATGGQNFQVNNSGKIYYTGLINSSSTSAATTGTSKQTLATFSISGGPQSGEGSLFINNAGAVVRVKAWGITASNSNTKVVEIDFGGTQIAVISSTVSGGAITIEADVICGANNVQECLGMANDGAQYPVITRTAPAITATNAIAINLAATTAGGSGDFTFKGWTIEYLGGK